MTQQHSASSRGARGRLVCLHGGGVRHRDYTPQLIAASHNKPAGYVARVACELGDHYLAPDTERTGHVVERTVRDDADVEMYRWSNVTLALAAIEQLAWQKQRGE